ncbi:hypothetical protein RB628_38015 [Streptomyces sp. ADMS]|uniref:hypothetical protein n=1 Tax=Streptomyces sp. ADMS TaxID=3071415 RepID=UPI00296E82E7|nr:hypothetical protein [Streptomyces sp. ADMS]MDW4910963.1 hypothetical protein [Streptomyces sp. ADMS]
MHYSPSSLVLALLCLAILAAALFAVLASIIAGLLAHWDGVSLPTALLRAGMAFGGTFTLLTALLTLIASALL